MQRLRDTLARFQTISSVDSTTAEKALFFAGLLVAALILYWLLSLTIDVRKLRRQQTRFHRLLVRYQRLTDGSTGTKRSASSEAELSYLSGTIRDYHLDDSHIVELTPAGEDPRGRAVYRVRLRDVKLATAFRLLKTLERTDKMGVRMFEFERLSAGSELFFATYRLVDVK